MMKSLVWRTLLCIALAAGLVGIPDGASAQENPWTIARRVLTPQFELSPAGISTAESALNTVPGAPQLPVKGFSVLLPLAGDWTLSYQSPGQTLLPQLLDIAPAPTRAIDRNTAENWLDNLEDLPASAPLIERPDPQIYGVDAFYPSSPVVAGEPVTQGGQRLLPIRVFPFQYNPVTRQVRHHPDLLITVQVTPADGQPESVTLQTVQPKPAVPYEIPGASMRVHTTERGLYRLTYDDLVDAEIDPQGLDPDDFAMYYKGEPIDILVTGAADNSFDDGDLVIFYAVPYDLGRFQNYNVYYFQADAAPYASRMQTRNVTAPGGPGAASVISQTVHLERNLDYRTTYLRPKEADHFYDTQLYANVSTPVVTKSYDLALDDPITATGSIALEVLVHGGNQNLSYNPDQSLDISLNNHFVDRYQWDGSVDHTITATLPASWLDAPLNKIHLTVDLAALPGIGAYWVSPDWVELTYSAMAEAESDRLYIQGVVDPTTEVVATGFDATTPEIMAFDVSTPEEPLLLDGIGTFTGAVKTVSWYDSTAAKSYSLASDAALLQPSAVEFNDPSNWAATDNDYDYLAIVGTERKASGTTQVGDGLSAAVQPLLDHRTQDGFTVAKIYLQDLYDEFSYGFVDPEAIRSFATYAYEQWPVEPGYVLLVGDGHYAYRGEVVTELPNLVPPYLAHVDPGVGEAPADSRFVSVDGPEDFLPDMAIGRIPANSAAEVTAVVNKILAYENAALTPDGDWQRRSVYVADNCTDGAGNFHYWSNDIRQNWLPDYYDDRIVYFDLPPANCPDPSLASGDAVRTAIKNEFNDGALFLQWFGHGSTRRWGSVSMFNTADPPSLQANNELPLVMHNACWTGYHVLLLNNNFQTLGETMLLTPGRGAVADYSPSGEHYGQPLVTLDQGIHQALFQQRLPRAGDVINASKYFYFDNSFAFYDLIDTMLFFGDPALKLRLPEGDFATSSFEVSESTAGPDASLVYTATVRNSSIFTTTEPLITIDYPQQWVTVADPNGGLDDGDRLSWTLPDLAAGGQDVVTFTLTTNPVLPAGNYDLTVPAEISSNMAPTVTLQVTTVTYAEPDLSTSALSVSRPWMGSGQAVTVTASLENTGAADSPGSALTLTLPAAMSAPIALSPGMTYSPISHTVAWAGDLPVTAAQVLTFTASAESAPITCTAPSVSGEVVDVLAASTALTATVNLAVPDVDCSGAVNVIDIQLVAGRWGAILGQPEYLYEYDLNGNDAIDVTDITIAANHWN